MLPHGVFEVVDHLHGLGLRFRRKHLGHVHFTQRFAQKVVDHTANPFPSRLELLCARQIRSTHLSTPLPPTSTLFPSTTLFRSGNPLATYISPSASPRRLSTTPRIRFHLGWSSFAPV